MSTIVKRFSKGGMNYRQIQGHMERLANKYHQTVIFTELEDNRVRIEIGGKWRIGALICYYNEDDKLVWIY
jgi:hypothetical protein